MVGGKLRASRALPRHAHCCRDRARDMQTSCDISGFKPTQNKPARTPEGEACTLLSAGCDCICSSFNIINILIIAVTMIIIIMIICIIAITMIIIGP